MTAISDEEKILSLVKSMPFLRIGYESGGWCIFSIPQSKHVYARLNSSKLLETLESIWIMEGSDE
jgi:hypothetical protein